MERNTATNCMSFLSELSSWAVHTVDPRSDEIIQQEPCDSCDDVDLPCRFERSNSLRCERCESVNQQCIPRWAFEPLERIRRCKPEERYSFLWWRAGVEQEDQCYYTAESMELFDRVSNVHMGRFKNAVADFRNAIPIPETLLACVAPEQTSLSRNSV